MCDLHMVVGAPGRVQAVLIVETSLHLYFDIVRLGCHTPPSQPCSFKFGCVKLGISRRIISSGKFFLKYLGKDAE